MTALTLKNIPNSLYQVLKSTASEGLLWWSGCQTRKVALLPCRSPVRAITATAWIHANQPYYL